MKELHAGRHLRMVSRNGWEFVERPGVRGVVIVVGVTPRGELLLVEQRREPVGAAVLELPAGLAGDAESPPGEPLEEAARRELVEETGFEAAHIEEVAEGPSTPGLSSERATLFLATGLRRVGAGGGVESEQITVFEVPLGEVEAFLRQQAGRGRAIDLKVYAALHFARRVT